MTDMVILAAPIRTMVPIIKVVGDFCNLRCRYCFYNTKDQLTPCVMSDELLEKFIVEYMELFSGQLRFIWHGGEPLLAGLSFFQRVIDLQEKNLGEGYVIRNDIQTNATLIDDQWASFFKTYDFRVGVSLDGSKESHDRFRNNYGGRGSFDLVMSGVETLRRHGVPHGFLQTLTRANLTRSREDFNFFVNILGTRSWGINHYLDLEKVNEAMVSQNITNKELAEFLKEYIDLWLTQDDPNLRIREIDNFLSGVQGKKATSCSFSGSCTTYFCLEYDGRIYPCDRLSGREELLFGDLSRQSLLEILNGPARLKYAREVNSPHPDCSICEWQMACRNGCPHHRIGGTGGKYYYCEARKRIFAYLKTKVEEYKASKQTIERR